METKFTPGPWRYEKQNGSPTTGQHMIAGAKPGYLAEVRDCGSGDVEANARLIAAAPKMFAALLLAEQVSVMGIISAANPSLLAKAQELRRAAIAEATGA